MCGIAGFINIGREARFGAETLSEVAEILAHRGPDDLGFALVDRSGEVTEATKSTYFPISNSTEPSDIEVFKDKTFQCGLMHRRLSIIQPGPEGHQPMTSLDGKVWISFNGEIYNYRTIRKRIEETGVNFKTETDTEVLLEGYLLWGKSVLQHLDGMWSFAILDLRKQILFASVDRAGIKPFYYNFDDSGFFFASEIKAFKAAKHTFSANWKRVNRFLAFGLSDEDSGSLEEETMVAGVFRLKAGQQLGVHLNDLQYTISTYHQRSVNPYFDFQPHVKEPERVEKIRELLVEMIRLRLQADVPLGVCLSGGIDSSTIAGLTAFVDRQLGQNTVRKAFMATLPAGSVGDESHWARLMARETGFDFYEVQPSAADFVSSISDFVYTLEEPAPGPNVYSQFAVFQKVASSGIKVSLDGQGADEIFGGYFQQKQMWCMEQVLSGNGSVPNVKWLIKNGLQHINEPSSAFQKWGRPGWKMLDPSVFEGLDWPDLPPFSLNAQLENDFKSSTIPFLLKAADRNSMRWSVESRMPFADFEPLISYLFQVEGSAKIQQNQTKYLLRKAAQPFVQQSVLDRRDKVGFAAPDMNWIRSIPDGLVRQLSTSQSAFWLNEPLFWQRWYQLKVGKSADWQFLWRILAVLFWQERVLAGKSLN